MEQTFRYKAFISYRHTERDKKIAGKLQKKLESYKPPKGIASEEKWKIFRDETELSSNANLSIKIKEALDTANAELENKNNALDKSNTELANTNKELDSANSELEKSNAEHRQRRAGGGKLRTHLLRGIRPSGRDRRTAEHTPVPRGLLSSASVSETLSQQSAVQLLRNRYAKAPARARYRKHDRGLQLQSRPQEHCRLRRQKHLRFRRRDGRADIQSSRGQHDRGSVLRQRAYLCQHGL